MTIVWSGTIALAGIILASAQPVAQELHLPPEVTPALRAACEADVRRMCIDERPTVEKVKSCMQRRFPELSSRCKLAIATAGLSPGRVARKEAEKQTSPQPRASASVGGTQPGRKLVDFQGD